MNPTIAIDAERRKLFVALTIPTLTHQVITVTQHLHPERDGRDSVDVECEGCGLNLTYHAASYTDVTSGADRDWGAYRDAADHASTHSRICGGTVPAALAVNLDAQICTYLLFTSEEHVEGKSAEEVRAVIQRELQRHFRMALLAVGDDYGAHPDTAPAHMAACVIAASRLLGVTP